MKNFAIRYTSPTGFAGKGEKTQFVQFAAKDNDVAVGVAEYIVSERDISGSYDIMELSHVLHVEVVEQMKQAA